MLRTLFLQAPSFDGFDGGAGSRYQAKREIKSFWFPTWLAQPAALVENSKLIDAPPHDQTWRTSPRMAKDYDLVVLHTSTPSFASDVKIAEALKAANPKLKIGLVGAKVAVDADGKPEARPGGRLRRPQRVRLHHQGRRRRQALGRHRRPQLPQREGVDRPQRGPRRSWRTWTRCRSSRRSTSAT